MPLWNGRPIGSKKNCGSCCNTVTFRPHLPYDRVKDSERRRGMEDLAIVELYWQRSEQAIQETSRKYGSYCRAIAQNILHDARDSEECVGS